MSKANTFLEKLDTTIPEMAPVIAQCLSHCLTRLERLESKTEDLLRQQYGP